MQRIVVFGATGQTGRLLCAELQERGFQVRAVVRHAEAAEMLPKGTEIAIADLRQLDRMREIVSGCDKVAFVAAGVGGNDRGSPRLIDFAAVEASAHAAAEEGIRHFVLLSSAGVTQPEHPHNCSFSAVLKWKYRGETALRKSGVPYTVVRALGLRDRPARQAGVRMVQGDSIAFGEDIARADVAAFLCDLLSAVDGDGLGFSPSFDCSSLSGATLEIYNDATIAAGRWDTAVPRLERDTMKELATL